MLDVGDLLAALNEVAIPARGRRAPGTAATANISRKKGPIVKIGYVLTSLAASTAVLSNQRNTGSMCSLVSTSALVVHADLRYGFEG